MKITRAIFKHKHIINSPTDESNRKLIKYLQTNNKHHLIQCSQSAGFYNNNPSNVKFAVT